MVTPFLHAAKSAPVAATAPTMYDVVNDFAKHTAMTAIAPRSSTVASVSKNAATPPGILFLKKLYTPIANAMSVAMGMAQPAVTAAAVVAGLLHARYIPIGTIIPPSAPMHGNAACFKLRSDPCTNSRLISNPTAKKKIAINPSLTQWCRDMCSANAEGPTCACQNDKYAPLHALFAKNSDTAVAPSKAMDPKPASNAACTSTPPINVDASSSAYGFGSDVRATLGRDDRATIARLPARAVVSRVSRVAETARDARMGARRGRAFIARARVVVVVLDPARGDIARDCIVVVVIARIVARVVRERASRVAE